MPRTAQPAPLPPLPVMPLDYQIPVAMAAYLNTANLANPPLATLLAALGEAGTGQLGRISVGNLQDDPRVDPNGVVTLHVGDIQDPAWRHEAITDQHGDPRVGGSRYQLLGGFREVGGGELWWYRYTAALVYFSPGDDQDGAFRKVATVVKWLGEQITAATPRKLGLVQGGNETASEIALLNYTMPEGGGPPDYYVWRARLHFQVMVHR